MGLFTGLALGGMAAFSAIQALRKKKEAPLAPPPVAPIGMPTPPLIDPAANNAAAQTAGLKQRKRAFAGSLLTHPQAPLSQVPGIGAKTAPKSLIGGY